MQNCNKCIRITSKLLLLVAITIFGIALLGKKEPGEAYIGEFGAYSFNENWAVQGDAEHQNITLPRAWKNDGRATFVLENYLPYYVDDGMRFMMRTALQDAEFYIDGKLRAEYTSDDFAHVNNHLPSAYVMIDLTEADAGKKIEISVTTSEQVKFSEVRIGYGNNTWFKLLQSNIPVVVAAVILVICGFVAVLFHFTLGRAIHANRAVAFLGEAMIVIGLWIISESQIRQLIFKSPSYSVFFSYMFVELIGGFVARYFDEVQRHKYEKIYIVFEILIFGQAMINAVLGLSGTVDFYNTLIFSHIWMIVGFILFITTVVLDIRTKHIRTYSGTAWGMLLFMLFALLEIWGFYTKDFYVMGIYICIGLLVLLAATLIQTIRDEMQKIRAIAELEKEKNAAISANRAKSEFLARMSHEIRTPINTVLGMNEMILRESRESNIREYAQDVKSSSMILLNLINDILDSSKVEAGKMEIVPVNYEIGSFLNDLYNMIRIKAEEKGLKLIFDVNPELPSEYYGDEKRIRQILVNLLTNAVKYTERGTITLTISGVTEGENATLHFSVKDTGIGIKEEDIGKIYDEFQRFELSRNLNIEGTGLGMNIVQQLLELMESELHIESEYGRGSEFSFELLQRVVNVEPVADFRGRMSSANIETNRVSYTAPEARVLVVDDYLMNLKVFKSLLKQTKIQIVEAISGKECLELLERERFDLVFLDHMMPEMDGIETFRIIKERDLCGDTPVIMLTANAIVGDKEKYLKEGFNDFLSKPIFPEKLDKIILQYLPEEKVIACEQYNTVSESATSEEPEKETLHFQSGILNELYRKLPEINFETGLATSSGDEEFYLELLQDFVRLTIKEELIKYFEMSNYENYCIRIHGFKNSAYSIGAKSMGELAYQMEQCTREGFGEGIAELQRKLFEQYDRVCEQYNNVVTQKGEGVL